ncbi:MULTISPECIES: signal recognition particle-docking protein FtsY [Planktothricoides]|uniref:Signal recognition particle receptor FtsY n=2 Tax=Planktothricoides raciborskii TaxID=132608 RepID=A0AAU8J8S0_9CYAN|nr:MULTISPECIES: signal recognition particle-docking protein FtsY [Planktothricoides]KOR35768.1 cell division protein [Planktothricoides sp. SR001]MBD2542909.1 signal recognition particle-docking protein FtsY [Planktothricoides raciborskii FACHB-1370]MBD2581785.1 signal recognition particle-docking protein FtsY [Planktothricoides raciborskii FACHB-1261]
MVFNWFRRQFDDKKQPEEKPKQEAPDPADSAPEPTTDSSEDSEDEYLKWAKAAYQNLQKQQQPTQATVSESTKESGTLPQEPPDESPVVESAASAIDLVEPEATPEAEVSSTSETIEIETIETVEPEATASPIAAPITVPEVPPPAETAETAEITAPVSEATKATEATVTEVPATLEPEGTETAATTEAGETGAETAAETETAPEAPQPILNWAKAEAERQERLKQLAETAMETPVEEDYTKPAVKTPAVPGMEFDEEFLWSAEVLARQGRRPDEVSIEEINWLQKLRQGLDKTRLGLINQLKSIVGAGPLNREAVTEIEAALLQADVGIEATDYIIQALQNKLREEALPPKEAIAYLKQILRDILDAPNQNRENRMLFPEKDRLNIWLIAGVNGAGKTTTIGKLAHLAQKSGYKTLIAAADTFRAAAVEQVKVWGERSGVEVIANPGKNTDPAAVVFDAIAAAQSRGTELLLVDTAGRLQNKKNLMEELSKIRRIIDKKAPDTIVEALIVLDATLGQNGLRQAEVFSEAINLSGVILTKLDGTAKGGIALAVSQQMGLPIRFIGAGEGIDDLRPFASYEFVEAMLNG